MIYLVTYQIQLNENLKLLNNFTFNNMLYFTNKLQYQVVYTLHVNNMKLLLFVKRSRYYFLCFTSDESQQNYYNNLHAFGTTLYIFFLLSCVTFPFS